MDALGVGGIDGGAVMDAESGVSPGEEQVDAFLGDELAVEEEAEDLMA